MGERVVLPLSL